LKIIYLEKKKEAAFTLKRKKKRLLKYLNSRLYHFNSLVLTA